MTPEDFIPTAMRAAYKGEHIFPEYAVCEAALESGWNSSELSIRANNLFGQKQSHAHDAPQYPVLELPTKEWDAGQLIPTIAKWPIFPDWATSFRERMNTLRRLAPGYPHYAAALAAPDGETFVTEVSKTWSTDPNRATNVLRIYNAHKELFYVQR